MTIKLKKPTINVGAGQRSDLTATALNNSYATEQEYVLKITLGAGEVVASSPFTIVDGVLTAYDASLNTTPAVINIPSGVTAIADSVFTQNGTITTVTIPSSVTTIGQYAFYLSVNIASVIFEDTVESPSLLHTIGANAFRNCGSLTSITIPSSVTTIGQWAFRRCGFSVDPAAASVTINNMRTAVSIDGQSAVWPYPLYTAFTTSGGITPVPVIFTLDPQINITTLPAYNSDDNIVGNITGSVPANSKVYVYVTDIYHKMWGPKGSGATVDPVTKQFTIAGWAGTAGDRQALYLYFVLSAATAPAGDGQLTATALSVASGVTSYKQSNSRVGAIFFDSASFPEYGNNDAITGSVYGAMGDSLAGSVVYAYVQPESAQPTVLYGPKANGTVASDGSFTISNWAQYIGTNGLGDKHVPYIHIVVLPADVPAPSRTGWDTYGAGVTTNDIEYALVYAVSSERVAPAVTYAGTIAPVLSTFAPYNTMDAISGTVTNIVDGAKVALYVQSSNGELWGPKGDVAIVANGAFTIPGNWGWWGNGVQGVGDQYAEYLHMVVVPADVTPPARSDNPWNHSGVTKTEVPEALAYLKSTARLPA